MKKFKDGLFRYNLQFFAEDGEGTSETTQEAAEPETADAEEVTEDREMEASERRFEEIILKHRTED